MKWMGILFVVLFLTSCTQNVGIGLGVAGMTTAGDNVAATEITADSQTGIHGSISTGSYIGL